MFKTQEEIARRHHQRVYDAIREGIAANRRGPEKREVAQTEQERRKVLSDIPAPPKLELL